MNSTTVAVLRGGPSLEYEVSMQTGIGVLDTLKRSKYNVKDIIISRTGDWLVDGFHKKPEQALCAVDVVFIALHGQYGEDGTVQRILDRLTVPYTGSGAYASAIAMNKELTKEHLRQVEIKSPEHFRVSKDGTTDSMKTALSISEMFGPAYIIKPTLGGSSFGMKRANGPHELGAALAELFESHDDLMVEEYITGREATVGILENFRNTPLYSMPVVEIIPPVEAGYFSADVKYTGATEEVCPGRFKKEEKDMMSAVAKLVHTHLNLEHYSRSDFIVNPDGVYFLEVNTLPGLTKESLFPKAMDAVGGNYNELVLHLISQARVAKV